MVNRPSSPVKSVARHPFPPAYAVLPPRDAPKRGLGISDRNGQARPSSARRKRIVPAERWRSHDPLAVSKRLRLRRRDEGFHSAGTIDRHTLFNNWTEVYGVLADMLKGRTKRGKWVKVLMVMEAMRLQACCGQCYASAGYLAAVGGRTSGTHWDRLLHDLRGWGLVRTARLVRPDNKLTVNLTDLSLLWKLLLRCLKGKRWVAQRWGARLLLKIGAFWGEPQQWLEWIKQEGVSGESKPLRRPIPR